jgi:hypothetical protein
LKFYLCQTTDGPQYVHLQADAKRIDPKFETVEVDLTKEAIMNRLNELMRQAHTGAVPDASLEEPQDIPPAPVAPPAPKPVAKPDRAARNDAQIAWEEFIWDIPAGEAYRLNTLQKVIEERRTEIEEGVNV